jgi:hypothetical protein
MLCGAYPFLVVFLPHRHNSAQLENITKPSLTGLTDKKEKHTVTMQLLTRRAYGTLLDLVGFNIVCWQYSPMVGNIITP